MAFGTASLHWCTVEIFASQKKVDENKEVEKAEGGPVGGKIQIHRVSVARGVDVLRSPARPDRLSVSIATLNVHRWRETTGEVHQLQKPTSNFTNIKKKNG